MACWSCPVGQRLFSLLALVTSQAPAARAKKMDCGEGVPLCGSLALESGLGPGAYHHAGCGVHGLWPAVGEYGSSQCIAPKSSADATGVYTCYQQANQSESQLLWFENHEWEKHGRCAGVDGVDDFFHQICDLSAAPLAAMGKATAFEDMVGALGRAGHPIFDVDRENDQIFLSACAAQDGRWKLADASKFQEVCGGGAPPAPGPSPPGPAPPAPAEACAKGRKGPKCGSDSDCSGIQGCVRCAHSGFCTDQPLAELVQGLLFA
ncbi:unnamed protein product [Prorocentrum cordatum]|uniref:Uncharacterized protein n=1 Tax=Prorocentrum cordatum TaxID=2364126 RepID=A0ABN9PQT5_9DINO|nr:unnamed protein product [Polarella glacialis]